MTAKKETPEQFFYRNAGYSYRWESKIPEEELQEWSKGLAEAEKWAYENDYAFDWGENDLGEDVLDHLPHNASRVGISYDGENIIESREVELFNSDNEVVQYGWAIAIDRKLGGPYAGRLTGDRRRVYEAELALDEMRSQAGVDIFSPWNMRPHQASPSSSDIDTINRHRSSIGMRPIDLASGWSSAELRDMAESIRQSGKMTNPLKKKLMR